MSRSTIAERVPVSGGIKVSPDTGSLPDGVLLDDFLVGRDEAAFESLMRRHGPSVMRVCRRWLGDGQDAEDACQATFLVLVNRAEEIDRLENIGGWLCGVARRVAGRAKMRADRRRVREGAAVDVREVAGRDEPGADDLSPRVRSEVDRLPEKYRRPIELCYWEGLSSEQAAERLNCPTGTLKWRLARAREILRGRLARLGMALAAVLMWRIPSAKAAGMTLGAGAGGRSTLGLGQGAAPYAEDVLSADFVRETMALAILARDAPLSFMKPTARTVRSKPGKQWTYNGPLIALLAAVGVVLTIPAVCLAIPADRRPSFTRQLRILGPNVKSLGPDAKPLDPLLDRDRERGCH
jgi:RNA polymerase sigma factor (sigma-70 family)